jgi:hypothetical protein
MKFLIAVFVVAVVQPGLYSKSLLSRDIEEVSSLLKRRQLQMTEIKEEIESIQKKMADTKASQNAQEQEFSSRLSKILLPLLHWPSVSFQKAQNSWIYRDHLKFTLMNLRSRLVHEPVVLISESEKALSGFSQYRVSLENRLKEMRSHEEVLSLQLEDLRTLQKKRKGK